jgi:hypothetical protein
VSDEIVKIDPGLLEREVIKLREECRRVLDELERRWRKWTTVPARIRETGRRAPRAFVHALGAHPILLLAGAAFGAAAFIAFNRRR